MRRDGIVSRIVRITLVSLVFLAMFGVVLSSHAVEADGIFWDDLGIPNNDWVTVEFLWVPAISAKFNLGDIVEVCNTGASGLLVVMLHVILLRITYISCWCNN